MANRGKKPLYQIQREAAKTPVSAKMIPTPGREWDDLEATYLHCVGITATPATVLPYLKNKALLTLIPNPKELLGLAEILAKDAKYYNERLQAIHDQHAGRTGNMQDEDLLPLVELAEAYNAWLTSYDSVVVVNTRSILALFETAAIALEKADAAATPVTANKPARGLTSTITHVDEALSIKCAHATLPDAEKAQ